MAAQVCPNNGKQCVVRHNIDECVDETESVVVSLSRKRDIKMSPPLSLSFDRLPVSERREMYWCLGTRTGSRLYTTHSKTKLTWYINIPYGFPGCCFVWFAFALIPYCRHTRVCSLYKEKFLYHIRKLKSLSKS